MNQLFRLVSVMFVVFSAAAQAAPAAAAPGIADDHPAVTWKIYKPVLNPKIKNVPMVQDPATGAEIYVHQIAEADMVFPLSTWEGCSGCGPLSVSGQKFQEAVLGGSPHSTSALHLGSFGYSGREAGGKTPPYRTFAVNVSVIPPLQAPAVTTDPLSAEALRTWRPLRAMFMRGYFLPGQPDDRAPYAVDLGCVLHSEAVDAPPTDDGWYDGSLEKLAPNFGNRGWLLCIGPDVPLEKLSLVWVSAGALDGLTSPAKVDTPIPGWSVAALGDRSAEFWRILRTPGTELTNPSWNGNDPIRSFQAEYPLSAPGGRSSQPVPQRVPVKITPLTVSLSLAPTGKHLELNLDVRGLEGQSILPGTVLDRIKVSASGYDGPYTSIAKKLYQTEPSPVSISDSGAGQAQFDLPPETIAVSFDFIYDDPDVPFVSQVYSVEMVPTFAQRPEGTAAAANRPASRTISTEDILFAEHDHWPAHVPEGSAAPLLCPGESANGVHLVSVRVVNDWFQAMEDRWSIWEYPRPTLVVEFTLDTLDKSGFSGGLFQRNVGWAASSAYAAVPYQGTYLVVGYSDGPSSGSMYYFFDLSSGLSPEDSLIELGMGVFGRSSCD